MGSGRLLKYLSEPPSDRDDLSGAIILDVLEFGGKACAGTGDLRIGRSSTTKTGIVSGLGASNPLVMDGIRVQTVCICRKPLAKAEDRP